MKLPTAKPPCAKRRPVDLSHHGRRRIDPYYWLRCDERQDPAVLQYLRDENQHTAAYLTEFREFQDQIFREITERLPPRDESLPYQLDNYEYFDRTPPGLEFEQFCRRRVGQPHNEELLLDLNERAGQHAYYELGGIEISDDHQQMAFAEDFVGGGRMEVRVKNLASGDLLEDQLFGLSGDLAWSADGRFLFYAQLHSDTERADCVRRHQLGTPQSQDPIVRHEKDPRFEVSLCRSRSLAYIEMTCSSTLSTEVQHIPADQPELSPQVFLPRAQGHEYYLAENGDHFYMMTNHHAPNFKLVRMTYETRAQTNLWVTIVEHRDDVLLAELELFEEHIVIGERSGGLQRLRCLNIESGQSNTVSQSGLIGLATLDDNPCSKARFVRYAESTLTLPWRISDYDPACNVSTTRKVGEVGGGYEPDSYVSRQLWVEARDGARVPVFLTYRRDTDLAEAPCLLEVYAAYGLCLEPTFCFASPSLLDRGFVCAMVQARGGMEMGRRWYDEGRTVHKHNSINDFIDAAQYLITQGLAHPQSVCGYGASAGGLIVGAAANQRPDLFHALIAAVPFVDLVTTMLDPTIPLTSLEYDEWGNPELPGDFAAMMSISPYDNVRRQCYPHMLVTTGLHDSRVGYWEPAKWVARLRANKTDQNLLLLHTQMDSGHHGSSGRFQSYADTALQYAFLIAALKKKKSPADESPARLSADL